MDSLACTQPSYVVTNLVKVPLAQCLQTLDALPVPLYVAALTVATPILPWHWRESLGEERDTLVDLSWSATTVQMAAPDSLVGSIFIYHPEQLFRICQVGRPRRVCLVSASKDSILLDAVIHSEEDAFHEVVLFQGKGDTVLGDLLDCYRIAQADEVLVLNAQQDGHEAIDRHTGVAIQLARHLRKRVRWHQEHHCSPTCLCQASLPPALFTLFPAPTLYFPTWRKA